MGIVNLNQQLKRVELKEFEVENEIVFNYFNNVPAADRDSKFLRALYIGVLALMEDRLSAFLSKTQNELGTELESLKLLFDMKKELFFKSAVKGNQAEVEIVEFLNQFFSERGLGDNAVLTSLTPGLLAKNKTGDIVCEVEDSEERIVIECKFDKSIRLGDIVSKDIFTKKTDTAWSQLLEAQANRGSEVGIIVFDVSLIDNSIIKQYENVGFIHGVGFIAVVDTQKGDYSNLTIAYLLARDIILHAKGVELDKELLAIIVSRIIKDIGDVLLVKSLVEANIETNKQILKQLNKGFLLMEFNQRYLLKFLKAGKLSKGDLLDFYQGEEVKEEFKLVEKEIQQLGNG